MPGTPATSPRLGLPRYASTDPATFAAIFDAIVDAADSNVARWLPPNTLALRPAPSVAERLYWATDKLTMYRDTGSAWQALTIEDLAVTTAKLAAASVTQAKIGADVGTVPVGGQIAWSGDGDPADTNYLLAEGRLIASASYPAFDALAGTAAPVASKHKYNGGIDPGGGMVRIPDKRGRVIVGSDTMGTAQGAAGRLPNSNRTPGSNGGEERHTLASTESGVASHAHGDTFSVLSANVAASAHVIPQAGGVTLALLGSGQTSPFQSVPNSTADSWTGISGAHTHALTGSVAAAAAASALAGHNNLQPYEVDNVIVRVK
jgi:hypothetical protein